MLILIDGKVRACLHGEEGRRIVQSYKIVLHELAEERRNNKDTFPFELYEPAT